MEEDEEAALGTCPGRIKLDTLVEGTIVATVAAAETDDGMSADTCCRFTMEKE